MHLDDGACKPCLITTPPCHHFVSPCNRLLQYPVESSVRKSSRSFLNFVMCSLTARAGTSRSTKHVAVIVRYLLWLILPLLTRIFSLSSLCKKDEPRRTSVRKSKEKRNEKPVCAASSIVMMLHVSLPSALSILCVLLYILCGPRI